MLISAWVLFESWATLQRDKMKDFEKYCWSFILKINQSK